jgi:serine/threonine protein phosphatase PrpC
MKLNLYQESRIGGRQANQDRVGYADTPASMVLVLADGMGGHARGEVAAQILVDVMLGMFRKLAHPALDDIVEFMLDGIYTAHETINEYAAKHKMNDVPRTTCVVCVIQGGHAYWAHVGDSRLYHFSSDKLLSRTHDHSAVQALLDEGLISASEANEHPERNRLYNSVGGFVLPEIELSPGIELHEGDLLLLATDGFWSAFGDDEMLATLKIYSLKQALVQLLDHAEYRGGDRGDNLSVIGLSCGEDRHEIKTLSDLNFDGYTTQLRDIADKRIDAPPALSDYDIDKAIEEIREALLKHKLDP